MNDQQPGLTKFLFGSGASQTISNALFLWVVLHAFPTAPPKTEPAKEPTSEQAALGWPDVTIYAIDKADELFRWWMKDHK